VASLSLIANIHLNVLNNSCDASLSPFSEDGHLMTDLPRAKVFVRTDLLPVLGVAASAAPPLPSEQVFELLERYVRRAEEFYRGDEVGNSRMVLAAFTLVAVLDRLAAAAHPLLLEHEVPARRFSLPRAACHSIGRFNSHPPTKPTPAHGSFPPRKVGIDRTALHRLLLPLWAAGRKRIGVQGGLLNPLVVFLRASINSVFTNARGILVAYLHVNYFPG
jgi:hypothetical protein